MASQTLFFLFSILSSGMSNSFAMSFNPDSENIQWPSCEELRHLWLTLRRMTYHGEITNEIPLIPSDLTANLRGYRHRNSHSRVLPINEQSSFNAHFPDAWNKDRIHNLPTKVDPVVESFPPNVPENLPNIPILLSKPLNNIDFESGGFFRGFENGFRAPEKQLLPFPDEPIRKQIPLFQPILNAENGAFGPISTNAESDAFGPIIPDTNEQISNFDGIYGAEEDVGSFGDFYDQNEPQDQRKPDIRTVKLSNIKWHNQPDGVESRPEVPAVHFMLDACDAIEKKPCSTSDHCACVGWETLHCINGKCRAIQDTSADRAEDLGTWHGGPLASFQLGRVSQKRRRGKRSKLM